MIQQLVAGGREPGPDFTSVVFPAGGKCGPLPPAVSPTHSILRPARPSFPMRAHEEGLSKWRATVILTPLATLILTPSGGGSNGARGTRAGISDRGGTGDRRRRGDRDSHAGGARRREEVDCPRGRRRDEYGAALFAAVDRGRGADAARPSPAETSIAGAAHELYEGAAAGNAVVVQRLLAARDVPGVAERQGRGVRRGAHS